MNTKAKQVEVGRQSNQPVWTLGAFFVGLLLLAGMCWVQYSFALSNMQRWYEPTYMKSGFRAWQSASSEAYYDVLTVIDKHGQTQIALPDQVESTKRADGTADVELTDTAVAHGLIKAQVAHMKCSDQKFHAFLADRIYANGTFADYCKTPAWVALGIFIVLAFFAGRKDRERSLERLRGQRLAGTEQVSVTGFNRLMRGRKKINGSLLDGVLFLDGAQGWLARQLNNYASRGVYVPREREQQHIVMMGDTGAGKTAAIRQVLLQVEERHELAIVYDSTDEGELIREFYDPDRGDIILNPLDNRSPYYPLADEIEDDAEAATVAASLFPEQAHQQPFFAEAARRLFAHLLCLQPTPEELLNWLSHPVEIDKRVHDTDLQSLISPNSPGQRNGVLASLSMIADALKLLPREHEAKGRFTAKEWAHRRKGWVFITSTPDTRIALRPLITLWLDLLVLNVMRSASGEKTWIVIDELHSLQRMPQLAMALTEARKAQCVMVLGFQGRAQIVDLYGPLAEVLLSQPATKLFFTTTDADAAKYISWSIGEVEYLRHRVSQSRDAQGQASDSQQCEIVRELLIMPSQIMGLNPLECYFKRGRYLVHLEIKYIEAELKQPAFLARKRLSVRLRLEESGTTPSSAPGSPTQLSGPGSSTQHEQEFFE